MLEPAIYDYHGSPVYINVPLREIHPTKPGTEFQWWNKELPAEKNLTVYRSAILHDDTWFVGEGNRIVHNWIPNIMAKIGLPFPKGPTESSESKLYGWMYLGPGSITMTWLIPYRLRYSDQEEKESYIMDNLPESWAQLTEGVVFTTRYDI